ncbi:hypothetical protein SAMN05421841_1863 [Chryseobacterium wanjuense]|uniref:Conjugal transfer protein TraD n=1 Tax=Chryseobacterium wanjuense TaxID=356305 RepID=A0A1I0QF40_9FLAO|nr:hypothetical protein SAMN05421841_1863 [Chryseobacterium wanjuense]
METLILICLVIVIILLLENNVTFRKRLNKKKDPEKPPVVELDIMGEIGAVSRQLVPKPTVQSHHEDTEPEVNNFSSEIDGEGVDIQIPQEEPDNVYDEGVDLQEEEEEWSGYGIFEGENGFATGVTFEELSAVGMIIQQDVLEASDKDIAVRIVHKIQGTELFSLLENSMEGASKRMAELLDNRLSEGADSGSSNVRKSDLMDFNIGDFV